MKQVFQDLKTGEIVVPEVPVPEPGTGEVLIRSRASLISLGTERMLLEFGRSSWLQRARQQPERVRQVVNKVRNDGFVQALNAVRTRISEPIALGNSNAGQVEAVGPGVDGIREGDRVASNGHHAEFVCVPKNLCALVPSSVQDREACFTPIAAVALEGLRLVEPTLGETVVVIGLGLIGQLGVQLLLANGCRVIGFDLEQSKVDLVRNLGVEAHVRTECDPVRRVIAATTNRGADAVLITTSTSGSNPIRIAPQLCRKRGRVVLVGVCGLELERAPFYEKEITFQVSSSFGPGRYDPNYEALGHDYPVGYVRWSEQRNFEAVLGLMEQGKLNTDPLVSKVISFERVEQAYKSLDDASSTLGLVLEYPNKASHRTQVILSPSRGASNRGGEVGVIGAGRFADRTLIPCLLKQSVGLAAICSAKGASAQRLGSKYGFRLATTRYEQLIESPEIDTIFVVTRHDSHGQIVLECLDAGKHVFVEKPLTVRMDELEEIEKRIRRLCSTKSPPLLTVGFNRRFSPYMKKIREELEEVASVAMIYEVNAGQLSSDHWVFRQDQGGRLIGEACHFMDTLRFLSASPISSSSALVAGGGDTTIPCRSR